MVHELPAPLPTGRDAANRALRTFFQGLAVDVGAAVAVYLVAALTSIQWTKEYWIGFGLALAKTVAVAATSYVYRLVKPPPSQ